MVASLNGELYTPVAAHYGQAHEDGPQSSEEGSDMHSPVFETQSFPASFSDGKHPSIVLSSYTHFLHSSSLSPSAQGGKRLADCVRYSLLVQSPLPYRHRAYSARIEP